MSILKRVIKQAVIIMEAFHFYQLHSKFCQHLSVKVNSHAEKLLELISVDFDVTLKLLIISFAFAKCLR
jgi:hypothetical protein